MLQRLSLLVMCLVWSVLGTQAQPWKPYVSPDQPGYKSYERTSQYVTMPDGVKLAVDVYIPTDGPGRETFPVVFKFTPYGRAYIGPNSGFVLRTLAWVAGLGWRPLMDQDRYSESIHRLLEHGYAVVTADMRGTGVSFGQQMPLDPQHGKDGKYLVDWIAQQPFCNGRVGMFGKSYMAWAQWATAAEQPKALKCIVPEVIFFESYTGSFKPGGITADRWMKSYSERLHNMNMNYADFRKFYIPTAPVVDEDKDGKLEDEWPQIDASIFEPHARPAYKDKSERTEHYYWNATLDHRGNVKVAQMMGEDFAYFNSKADFEGYPEVSYSDVANARYLQSVMEADIPVFNIGRWHDGFTKGTTRLFASAQHLDNHRLLITPGFHRSSYSKKQRKYLGFEPGLREILAEEHLRFYDRHLKTLDNGWDTLPQVRLFVPHGDWQGYAQWPPKAVQETNYFLSAGQLQTSVPKQGVDTIPVDTLHSSSYGKRESNRWMMASLSPKKPMERTQLDQHATVCDTEPLEEAVQLIGHPTVDLWVSSNRPNADVFVYLVDVDEKGRSFYVTEGQLRASWHRQANLVEQLGIDYEIRPELPWHGYIPAMRDADALASGEPVRMHFDLKPIAWNFEKGHRIRIAIAGMDKQNFEENPAYFENGKLRDDIEIYLHQSDGHQSLVTLPLIE